MRRAPLWLLSVSAVFLLTGCATTLRLNQEKPPVYLSELRAQFFTEFPESPYSVQVKSGQVVKGMDRFGVLASWGYPEKRTRAGLVHETWFYVDIDESSGNSVEYTLAFRDGVLEDWSSTRLNTGMVPVAAKPAPSEQPPKSNDMGGKTIPQN
jgi:hypothetical protein